MQQPPQRHFLERVITASRFRVRVQRSTAHAQRDRTYVRVNVRVNVNVTCVAIDDREVANGYLFYIAEHTQSLVITSVHNKEV